MATQAREHVGGAAVERRIVVRGELAVANADREAARRALGAGPFAWVDITAPDDDEIAWLTDVLGLHRLEREDLEHFGQRPKLDPYGDHGLLVVYGAHADGSGLVEVHCVIAEGWLVTVHREPCPALGRLASTTEDARDRTAAVILHRVVDALIDSFFPALAAIDDRVDELEGEIIAEPHQAHLQAVLDLKRRLIGLRKVVSPQRDLFAQIAGRTVDVPGMDAESEREFRDVYDHLIRVSDMIDTYRDLLTGTMDVYLSSRADRRDAVMKQLTVIATVFLPITFITGFFGQNFAFMVRHIDSPLAFAVGVLLQVATVVGILWTFRRRGWI
jgi:magnesium transporter